MQFKYSEKREHFISDYITGITQKKVAVFIYFSPFMINAGTENENKFAALISHQFATFKSVSVAICCHKLEHLVNE